MTRKGLIFDRDGTLIVDKIYLNDPHAIEFYPETFEALRILRDLGFSFAVATNQSGVARGLVSPKNLDLIHALIQEEMARHGIDILSFHCAPYMTDFPHHFRKPNPGMLLEAARWHRFNPAWSWMVGDRMSDVEAGHRAGFRSARVRASEEGQNPDGWRPPEIEARDLLDLAHQLTRNVSCGQNL